MFLVHGMEDFAADSWSLAYQETLRNVYSAYKPINQRPFDQLFEFQPFLYNEEFEVLRDQWRNNAGALATVLSGAGIDLSLISKLDSLAGSTGKTTFLNTHVADVLLYRFFKQTAAPVREAVRQQIFRRLNRLSATEPRTWPIIVRSLGAAVVHDALHEANSKQPTAAFGNRPGMTRPTRLAKIENVSRVLETNFEVYQSRVRPGNPFDPLACCRYYLNALHAWDPIPQVKAFRPGLVGASSGVRLLKPPLFLNVEVSKIEH
jgi:hypothetical protein